MTQQISWGSTTFLLHHDRFEQGYQRGRRSFFEDGVEQETPDPITVPALLRLVAVPDEQERYQLDDGVDVTAFGEGVEELIGVLVGSLGGPLSEETPEEAQQREDACVVIAPRFLTHQADDTPVTVPGENVASATRVC